MTAVLVMEYQEEFNINIKWTFDMTDSISCDSLHSSLLVTGAQLELFMLSVKAADMVDGVFALSIMAGAPGIVVDSAERVSIRQIRWLISSTE